MIKKILFILCFATTVPLSADITQQLERVLSVVKKLRVCVKDSLVTKKPDFVAKSVTEQIPVVAKKRTLATPVAKKHGNDDIAVDFGRTKIIVHVGNMLEMPVDCIVNPGNIGMIFGKGLTGLILYNIHPSSDMECIPPQGDISGTIVKELKELIRLAESGVDLPITQKGQLLEGAAVITSSGTIQFQGAKTITSVITTVGPQGPVATLEKNQLLWLVYYNSLKLASGCGIKSIAFPAISTGIFNYPVDDAAAAAYSACDQFIKDYPDTSLNEIYLVYMKHTDLAYTALLKRLGKLFGEMNIFAH